LDTLDGARVHDAEVAAGAVDLQRHSAMLALLLQAEWRILVLAHMLRKLPLHRHLLTALHFGASAAGPAPSPAASGAVVGMVGAAAVSAGAPAPPLQSPLSLTRLMRCGWGSVCVWGGGNGGRGCSWRVSHASPSGRSAVRYSSPGAPLRSYPCCNGGLNASATTGRMSAKRCATVDAVGWRA
jgi:hypothetical protein